MIIPDYSLLIYPKLHTFQVCKKIIWIKLVQHVTNFAVNRHLYVMNVKRFEKEVYVIKDKLFRFATRILNNPTEAEDVVQELLSKFWENRKDLKKYRNIEAYAMQVIKNICYDKIRHLKVIDNSHAEIRQSGNSVYSDDYNENKEMQELIRQSIDRLPEKQKLVMHLRDIEGYSFEEIGAVLNIDIIALRVNLSRARKKVRSEILKTVNYGV